MNETSGVRCVGIILDGNRRWARAHNRPIFDGHAEGYKRLKEVLRWSHTASIAHVVAYAFSTENWRRPEEEVGYLMKLLRSVLESETEEMVENRIRVIFTGDRSRFAGDLQEMMGRMENATAASYDVTLHLLMSYGGRAEIVAAANALLSEGKVAVTEDTFTEKLWSHDILDPDIIIRTGGEKRLSNFLPWQSVYSELFFTNTLWPDFTKEEFEQILVEYRDRKRNFGA